jgi:hypothetical protein
VGVGAPPAALTAGAEITLQVLGHGGIPASGVSAVALNVTVTTPTQQGFLSVYAYGTTRPGVSNLNFVAGQSVSNLVLTKVSSVGEVTLYNGSAGTVQLLADVSGYYLSGAPTAPGAFGPVDPSRLLDTRSGMGAPQGPVAAGATVVLQVLGSDGVPASGVSAVALNVTVTAPTQPGFVTVYGDGATRPAVSNLNFVPGQSVPNLVIASVGADGKVALYNGSAGKVQLLADVSGYYLSGTPSVPGVLAPLSPNRLLDTRSGVGAPQSPVAAGGTVALQVLGRGGIPTSGVSAVVLNVTVTSPMAAGWVSAYGDGMTSPGTSNVNFAPAQTAPNLVIAPRSQRQDCPVQRVRRHRPAPGRRLRVHHRHGYSNNRHDPPSTPLDSK